MKKLEPRVIKPLEIPTILEVPHDGRIIQFAYPAEKNKNGWNRPDTDSPSNIAFRIMKRKIFTFDSNGIPIERKLRLPTPDETASLLRAAYFDLEAKYMPEFKSIACLRTHFFYQALLWAPKGVYMVNDPSARGSSIQDFYPHSPKDYNKLGIEKVELMLKSQRTEKVNGVTITLDKKMAFAPRDTYAFGEQDLESFAKSGFATAFARGKEGAESFTSVAWSILPDYLRKVTLYDEAKEARKFHISNKKFYASGDISLCLSSEDGGEDTISDKPCFRIGGCSGPGISLGVIE